MPVSANTVETFDVSTIREDLQEAYSMISPEEVPFQTMGGVGEPLTQKQFDWPIAELQAPDGSNRVAEGENAPGNDTPTLPTRHWNFAQISDKVAEVSHTAQASSAAANDMQRMDSQVALKMKELKRDKEVMVLQNIAASVASSGNARVSAGFPAFLRTNANGAAGSTAPTLSGTTEGFPDAGWGDGTTPAAMAEETMNDIIQACWEAGAEPNVIMVNGGNKRVISRTFTGYANRYKDAVDKTLVASIDFYDSDFGDMTVIPNRFQPTLNEATDDDNYPVYILDPEYYSIRYLDPVQRKPLAETGHSIRAMVWCEYGLQVDNEAAHGIYTDTTNTAP